MTTLDPPDPDDDETGLVAREQSDVEREAAEAARRAQDEAFGAFYRQHVKELVAFLIYLGAPLREAEDLAQETMNLAYLKWHTLHQPRGWILRVASRIYGRWAFRTREEPSEGASDDVPSHAGHGSGDWLDALDLPAFLRTLPPRQRQVMAWTLLEYQPHEIAEELGTTSDVVRGNLREARRKCREWRDQRDRGQDEDTSGEEDR